MSHDKSVEVEQTNSKEDEYLLSSEVKKKLFERINGISSVFNINYPINPKIKYEYPPINRITIENIVNALITYPKFYIQTLHLMNKMNLPCPLVSYIRTSRATLPFINESSIPNQIFTNLNPMPPQLIETQNDMTNNNNENLDLVDMMTSQSESESEVESEIEIDEKEHNLNDIVKRPGEHIDDQTTTINQKSKRLKVKSYLKSSSTSTSTNNENIKSKEKLELDEIFDKRISIKKSQPKIIINNSNNNPSQIYDRDIVPSEVGSFPKILPLNKQNDETNSNEQNENPNGNDEADVEKSTKFISKHQLEKNRLKISELRDLPVYKNYERGEVNTRIYVKNLSKKVDESELKFIFGRYINWTDESQQNSFDIRLMKEGRMKGQAFITLPNEEIATKALNETNGYLLHEKPMIVSFARSAKPK